MKLDKPQIIGLTWIVAAVLFIGFMEIRNTEYLGKLGKALIDAFPTLVAAFGGAYFAFRLNNSREFKKISAYECGSINRALYELSVMYNRLAQNKREQIDAAEECGPLWFTMLPQVEGQMEKRYFDSEKLVFLLRSTNPSIYGDLFLEEKRYNTIVAYLEKFSTTQEEKIQPIVESLGIKEGERVEGDMTSKVKAAVGDRLIVTQTNLANAIKDHTVSSLASIKEVGSKLQELAISKYGKDGVIKLEGW